MLYPLIKTPCPQRGLIISQHKTSFLRVVFDGDHDLEGPRAPKAALFPHINTREKKGGTAAREPPSP